MLQRLHLMSQTNMFLNWKRSSTNKSLTKYFNSIWICCNRIHEHLFLTHSVTCTGSTGLVTGLACAVLLVVVESCCAALLAPISLQTGEERQSMWLRDTQPIMWHRKDNSLPLDSVFQPTANHHKHSNWVSDHWLQKLLSQQYGKVIFCPFLWWCRKNGNKRCIFPFWSYVQKGNDDTWCFECEVKKP